MVVIGVLLPALIAQDYWRAMAFALHRPSVALANDVVFVGAQARRAASLVIAAGARTAPWFILAWGFGGLAGGVAGFLQFRVPLFRRGDGPLFVHTWPFSRWLLADFLTIFAADQTYLLLVAVLLGQAAFGEPEGGAQPDGPDRGHPADRRQPRPADAGPGQQPARSRRPRVRVAGSSPGSSAPPSSSTARSSWSPVRGCSRLVYGPDFASAGNLARIGALHVRGRRRCASVPASPSASPARRGACGRSGSA